MKRVYLAIIVAPVLLAASCSKPKQDAPAPSPSAASAAAEEAGATAEADAHAPAASSEQPAASASAVAEAAPSSAARDRDAGHRGDAGARGLARFDKDGDGRITREEAPARLKRRFDKLDANHDGVLDASEWNVQGRGKGHGKGHHGKGKGHADGGHGKTAPAPAEDSEEP